MRVGRDVCHVVDATSGHCGLIQRTQHIHNVMLGGPCAYRRIDLFNTLHASTVVLERRVLAQVITSNGVHQTFEDAVAIACNQYIGIALAAVRVAGRNAGQGAASSLSHSTKSAVFGQQAFHAIEDGFIQRHIDHLALAAALAFVTECGDNAYTVEQAHVELRKRIDPDASIPVKLLDGLGLVIGIRNDIVTLRVDSELTTALHDAMRAKSPVRVQVHQSEEEPDFKVVNAYAAHFGGGYLERRIS